MAENQQCKDHSGCMESIKNLQDSDKTQWKHIDTIEAKLPKLVPVWVTIVLMISSALTGSALTFAGMIIKFSGNS